MKRLSRLTTHSPSRYACLLLLSCSPLASHAAVLVGPGQSATVEAGTPAEFWEVRDGASLILKPGSEADGTGSGLNSAIALVNGSSLTAQGATIRADGRAILNNQSTLSLTGSRVTAKETGDTSPGAEFSSGVALLMLGGNATISGSVLDGERHAIAINSDISGSSADLTAVLDIAGSQLVSSNGSAIYMGNLYPGEDAPPIAHITLRDGTVVSAGNGNLLEVHDDAQAFLTIKASDITGNITSEDTAYTEVNLLDRAILRGSMQGVDKVAVADSAAWIINGDSSIGQLNNAGTVAFSDGAAGRTLTVEGNYAGNGGTLVFNSVLGGDDSLTDKLIVKGDTSGTTSVRVNNLGGSGAKTLNGIELITVGGNSAGEFQQSGRIAAGAYDYHLVRGEGANSGNWYLSNELSDPDNPDPGPGPAPTLVVRPEGGAYAANLYAMNTLFDASVSERSGETERADTVAANGSSTNLWMKNSGGHQRATDNSGQLNTHTNRYALLLGADLAGGLTRDGGAWRAGAFAGYGYSHGTTTSQLTNHHAGSEVKGYTTGVYGTWYADGNSEQGLYTDAVLQYSWFDAQVTGEDVAKETYSASGVSTSLEAGYVFRNALDNGSAWYLQPKAKVFWSGVTPDDHREDNGTIVSSDGSDTLSVSVGARAFLKLNYSGDDTLVDSFKPFVEANWIHNSRQAGVTLDGASVSQVGTRNIAEFKAGAEGRVNRDLTVTAALAQQAGTDNFSDTAASLALRWSF
ncbi:autotransporter outer membrane beta-barrel domain-containing protein [Pseudomonas sp. BCRC 81390]|uniref:autotransporter outer membrane beta-barrel domain-containing protein n=1 Tax=Pseudomonas sp. BCRC 81390 TaxID=3054778 RepID=UPI002595689B|nr:autotransporter outer membrane beta-barrel domain-containing protein [Pseudomonas sp. BCRC 81390]MDM3888856.1 autotransporter outer membrane beta-barrel domain-containing protein [Pseudomonas sp. BCRC 81390]